MQKQEQPKRTRALIQFWVEPSIKERVDKLLDHHGQQAHIARTAFIKELERLEKLSKNTTERKAS